MKDILKLHIGQLAENKACDFLLTNGLHLIDRNYHCYYGEIDLIMRDTDDIVFIEVRSRISFDYGSAIESVNKIKQQKLIKSAKLYLQKRNWFEKVNCRFDVIGISRTNCEWIKNAFSMEGF